MITKPKFKICRRLGPGVYDKCQTSKFSTTSGKFGGASGKRPKALTEYGAQLVEKQKIRFSYGISERQLSNYVKKATQVKGSGTSVKFYEMLESRLDNVIYRMGLAASRRAARQMVSHGHFIVNNNIFVKNNKKSRAFEARDLDLPMGKVFENKKGEFYSAESAILASNI